VYIDERDLRHSDKMLEWIAKEEKEEKRMLRDYIE
jgi:hypothetical protein